MLLLCCAFQSDWGGASAAHYSSPALHSATLGLCPLTVLAWCMTQMLRCTTPLSSTTRLQHPHWLFNSNRQNVIHLPSPFLLGLSTYLCISLLYYIHHLTLSLPAFPRSPVPLIKNTILHIGYSECSTCLGTQYAGCFKGCALWISADQINKGVFTLVHCSLTAGHNSVQQQHTSLIPFKEMGQDTPLKFHKAQNRTTFLCCSGSGRTTAFWRGVSKAQNAIWERQLASLMVSFCEACLLLSVMLIYLNSIKGRPSGWCSGRQKHSKRLSNQFAPTPTFFIISGCCLQKFLIRWLVVCTAALCASFVFCIYMILQ